MDSDLILRKSGSRLMLVDGVDNQAFEVSDDYSPPPSDAGSEGSLDDNWPSDQETHGDISDGLSIVTSYAARHDSVAESEESNSRSRDFDEVDSAGQIGEWDVYEETPWENFSHANRNFWLRVHVISRVVFCIFLFFFITFTSSVSVLGFLIIAFNMNSASKTSGLSSLQAEKPPRSDFNVRWVWAAILLTSAPPAFTFCRCMMRLSLKRTRSLTWRPLLLAVTIETLHSVGLNIFLFMVAPSYDPLLVLMLSQAQTLVPASLRIYRGQKQKGQETEELRVSFKNALEFLLSLGFLVVLGYKFSMKTSTVIGLAGPVAMALVSVVYWDNFIPVLESWKIGRRDEIRHMRKKRQWVEFTSGSILFRAKHAIKDRRTKIDAVCSVWKMFLNLLLPLILLAARGGTQCVSTLFLASDSASGCVLWADDLGLDGAGDDGDWCKTYLPFAVAGICILASVAAYKAAQVSCKINAQQPCFSLPLLLTVPITFIISLTTHRAPLSLFDCSVLWPKLSPDSSLLDLLKECTSEYWLPAVLVGFLQLALICAHVWTPTAERVASTDKLFVRPMFCGILFVQSMLYSRAVDDHELPSGTKEKKNKMEPEDWTTRLQSMTFEADTEDEIVKIMNSARFPRIYACATMWHETAREMTQLLKSLFRMDSDQFLKSCMWKRFNVVHKDFYHYEAHIFFDDAFKKISNNADENCYTDADFAVNDYVIQFCSVVEEASESVYPPGMSISAPEKIVTPYGGRLVYELPGGNPLVVHLKNKFLIRHKKRWSQVMYMYYLLSYRLLLGKSSKSEKIKLADNTFLLTLDGDVDFHPDAVQLLVDRMKRNSNVGAACGRIHPVGSGLMVWYQKFEYAVSHWLQKAAEHVFGCVLCSPGCFSLFRGSALMADNVLKRYSKKATTARHAVQYDMGEDRWLCTLLLQQGKRVEYAAAADALTFCPDDFGEFFTQRRRWTPSTMANILDLLSDWRHVTEINSSVSFAFICYQTFLFISSVLTPGTIFLLIFGAINTAYPSMPLYGAMLVNFAPIFVFIVLCFVARSEVQIAYATILSTAYSLVMMIVLVGLLRQIQESGLCSVTAIFFLGIAVIFVATALLHPQEMGNIFFGILYFLAIPCTSMILVFYAVANLNVVTWGTRDSNTPSGGQKKSLSERLGLQRVKQVVGGGAEKEVEKTVTSHYTFSFGNLFRCICCPLEKTDDTAARFSDLENALYDLKRAVLEQKGPHHGDNNDRRGQTVTEEPVRPSVRFDVGPQDTAHPPDGKDTWDGGRQPNSGSLLPDCWWQEEALGLGFVKYLAPDESSFWSQVIEKYLKPLQTSTEEQEQMAKDLTMLRNKAAMLFFLGNALFVTIIFILESVAEYSPGLTIQLPCDQGHVGQKIEPISVVFTVIFGILLCLQFIAMLIHRLSTLVHIIASTGFKKEDTGNERDNFNRFGFYDLTRDIVYGKLLQRETDASMAGSDITHTVTRTSADGDTATEISFHPVEVLLKRQLTRGRSLKKTELQKVFDEQVTTVIEGIDNVGESSDSPDAEETPDGQTKDKDKDKDEQQVHEAVQRRLPWLRGHSIKAAATLAKNKAMKEVVVLRTERAQNRWKEAIDKVMRPSAMADLVGKVLHKKRTAEVLRAGTSAEDEETHTPLKGIETSTTLQMTPPTRLQMAPPATLQSVTVTNESMNETGQKVSRSKAVKGRAPPPPPPQGSARSKGLSNKDSIAKDTPESKQTLTPMKTNPQLSSKDDSGTPETPIKPTPGTAGSTAEQRGVQTVASKLRSALKNASKGNDTPVTVGAAVEKASDADPTMAASTPRSALKNTTKADGTPVAAATAVQSARDRDSSITARKTGSASKKASETDDTPPTSAASPGTTGGKDATTTASTVTPSRTASDTQSSAAAAEKPLGRRAVLMSNSARVEKRIARKPVEASTSATAAASVATASTDSEKAQEAPLAVTSKASTGSARSEARESEGEATETRF